MTEPSAKIIADSISPAGHRLTTMEIVMHRFVLAEFNTHRVFSRNSASSRAIPISLTLKQYNEDPAMPISYPAEQPGMSGGAELQGADLEDAKYLLYGIQTQTNKLLGQYVLDHPEAEHRLHKSILNRYLEPFRWHTVVCSSTEWSNFFEQRVSPLAQPEMRVVAEAMQAAFEVSKPREIILYDWHTPYVDEEEKYGALGPMWGGISAARCARVSRERQGSVAQDIEADLKMYERLIYPGDGPPHASPLEHVATPCTCREGSTGTKHHGNFVGWDQLRWQALHM